MATTSFLPQLATIYFFEAAMRVRRHLTQMKQPMALGCCRHGGTPGMRAEPSSFPEVLFHSSGFIISIIEQFVKCVLEIAQGQQHQSKISSCSVCTMQPTYQCNFPLFQSSECSWNPGLHPYHKEPCEGMNCLLHTKHL